MANRKITEFASILNADLANGDIIPIVDISEAVSTDKNKSITIEELDKRYINASEDVDINAKTAKTTPVGADLLLIDDSEDSNTNKKLTITNLDTATSAFTSTLTNKTINLTSNTLSGTKAQFNTALSDDDFAFIGDINTFTQNNYFTSAIGVGSASIGSNKLLVKGAGATSATTSTTIENSASTSLLTVRDDGLVTISTSLIVGSTVLPSGYEIASVDVFAGSKYYLGNTADGTESGGLINLSNTSRSLGIYVDPNNVGSNSYLGLQIDGATAVEFRGGSESYKIASYVVNTASTSITYSDRVEIGAGTTYHYSYHNGNTIASGLALTDYTFANVNGTTMVGGSTITNAYGFRVVAGFTTAINNYGFYGNVPSGSNRWNIYMNGTAENYLNGNLLIGTTTSAGKLTVRGSGATSATNTALFENSSGTDILVVRDDGYVGIGVTSPLGVLHASGTTAAYYDRYGATAANFVLRSARGTSSSPTGVLTGEVVGSLSFDSHNGTDFSNAAYLRAIASETHGVGARGTYLVIAITTNASASPSEKMRIDNTGSVGIGSTSLSNYSLRVGKSITGGVAAVGVAMTGEVQSDVTTSARYFQTTAATQATSFTLTEMVHYLATQGTFGASSTVTNQYGFNVSSGLIGATNNYGFYSNIASNTGRWNFYANGTATNHFAGSTFIGTTTDSGRLTVRGAGTSSATNTATFEDSSGTDILVVRDDGFVSFREFISAKTADYTVLVTESQMNYTNTGATGTVNFTLPTASAGYRYTFYCNAAQSIRVTAAAGDVIRRGASVTAAAGNVLTPAAIGNYIEIMSIDATTWVMTSSTETSAFTFT